MSTEIEKIKEKAEYCLNCKAKPCAIKGCPLGNNIPEFIKAVKGEDYISAYKVLSETTVLPGVCGRICPHKKQCEGSCVRGIKGESVSIGDLEAFVFDKMIESKAKNLDKNKGASETENQIEKIVNSGAKVAVVGGGPAGVTCSAFLAKKGVQVTIYEKYDYLGGLLMHGIPKFRLPKSVVKETAEQILNLGINVKYNQELGKNLNLEDLEKEYDAVFLGLGANVSTKMGVEGEELDGVFGGNEFLEYGNHPDYAGKSVAIIGGGNVAMDCARTVKRLGAKEVKVIYRRAREQMPAEEKEIEDATKEGIEFVIQNNIVKIIGTEKVERAELIKTELVQKEGEARLVPVNVENSNYIIDVDYIIMALGSKPAGIAEKLGLKQNEWGNIGVNERYQTSKSRVYAGGDFAGIKQTVAWAARSGRDAAKFILEDLKKSKIV